MYVILYTGEKRMLRYGLFRIPKSRWISKLTEVRGTKRGQPRRIEEGWLDRDA